MARIKLAAGGRIAMRVAAVNTVMVDDKQTIQFSGQTMTDAEAVFLMSPATATRQLSRIQYDWSSVIGQTVEFGKVHKDGKDYLDINRTDPLGTGVNATAPVAPQVASSLPPVAGMTPIGNVAAGLPPAPATMPALAGTTTPGAKQASWDDIITAEIMCLREAYRIAEATLVAAPDGSEGVGFSSDNICSIAATLLIAGQKRGLV